MYRILYDSADTQKKNGRCAVFTIILFFLFCGMVYTYWPEGRILLRTLLIPGDPDTTLHAAEVFAAELSCGGSISNAVRNFFDMAFGI